MLPWRLSHEGTTVRFITADAYTTAHTVLLHTPPFLCLPPSVISPPVGYQRVQGRGDDDGEGEGEGEGESDKELYVKEGHITHPKTNPEEVSKPHPAHTSIKVSRKELVTYTK